MSFFSEERASELKDLFFESATELLQALNEEGLELEKHPGDAEVVLITYGSTQLSSMGRTLGTGGGRSGALPGPASTDAFWGNTLVGSYAPGNPNPLLYLMANFAALAGGCAFVFFILVAIQGVLLNLFKAVIANNRAGGWRRLQRSRSRV